MTLSIDDFLNLRSRLPLVDVRSEKEFEDGHMRMAVNLPMLNNDERREVGIVYKQRGQMEAIKTGFRLVGPRFASIIEEAERIADGRELLVHCWRGGMRSSNFCQLIAMAKIKSFQLAGGYKAYRERAMASYRVPLRLHAIGGLTGSGKSDVLRALREKDEQIIDLEALARHKGSAFGGLMMPPQPSTEQFQNDLFEELRQLDPSRPIWIEDESIAIGKIVLPYEFWKQMSAAPLFDVSADKAVRLERLVREYGAADKAQFLAAMQNITKKLGGQHFKAARERLEQGDMASTIDILLSYYDKAYTHGLKKREQRIRARIEWDGRDPKACADELIRLACYSSGS